MLFRCRDCNRYVSAKPGAALEASNLPLKTWVWAICLGARGLKGVSSIKQHRDLGVRQATTWFMLQRIGEGLVPAIPTYTGPVAGGS